MRAEGRSCYVRGTASVQVVRQALDLQLVRLNMFSMLCYLLFDTWTEREERVAQCLHRTYVLLVIEIKLCYTDSIILTITCIAICMARSTHKSALQDSEHLVLVYSFGHHYQDTNLD
jgi:hypothetical protein